MLKTKQNKGFNLPVFLEFVEIKTKVASFFPMAIGILWSLYRYQKIDWLSTSLFALAVLSFDMCTTAINNTMDYYKAHDMTYRETENVVGKYQLKAKRVVEIIVGLLLFSIMMSLVLVWQTDLVLLPMGIVCFLIGIFYTFGPLPLSRLPLGEVFSGLTMGFGIFFLAVFVQEPALLVTSQWSKDIFSLHLAWKHCLEVLFMSLPLVCLIANIMLANNICDFEEDLRNKRRTLVSYIGQKDALLLYAALAFFPWVCWLLYGLTGFLPLWSLLGLICAYPAYKSLRRFLKKQIKRETFIEAVKSFVLYSLLYSLTLLVALFF